jgi:hypothetical protein
LTRFRAHGTRNPIDRTQLVENGALDARDCVRLELVAASGIKLFDGVDQSEDAVADEVGLLHVLWKSDRDAARDVLHQR